MGVLCALQAFFQAGFLLRSVSLYFFFFAATDGYCFGRILSTRSRHFPYCSLDSARRWHLLWQNQRPQLCLESWCCVCWSFATTGREALKALGDGVLRCRAFYTRHFCSF